MTDHISNRRADIIKAINNSFESKQVEPSKIIEIDEETFDKAISESNLEVYSEANIQKFNDDLLKSYSLNSISQDQFEKAKKDLSKLVKVRKMDKTGKMSTYYVKPGEEPKKEKPKSDDEDKAKKTREMMAKEGKKPSKEEPKPKLTKNDQDKVKKTQEMIANERKTEAKRDAGKTPAKKPSYESHTGNDAEQIQATIKRQESLLANPKSPESAKAKARHIIDIEKRKLAGLKTKAKPAASKPKPKSKPKTLTSYKDIDVSGLNADDVDAIIHEHYKGIEASRAKVSIAQMIEDGEYSSPLSEKEKENIRGAISRFKVSKAKEANSQAAAKNLFDKFSKLEDLSYKFDDENQSVLMVDNPHEKMFGKIINRYTKNEPGDYGYREGLKELVKDIDPKHYDKIAKEVSDHIMRTDLSERVNRIDSMYSRKEVDKVLSMLDKVGLNLSQLRYTRGSSMEADFENRRAASLYVYNRLKSAGVTKTMKQSDVEDIIEAFHMINMTQTPLSKSEAYSALEDIANGGEEIEKAKFHKYYRREGSPGNYKYYYTKEDYDKASAARKVMQGVDPSSEYGQALRAKIERIENQSTKNSLEAEKHFQDKERKKSAGALERKISDIREEIDEINDYIAEEREELENLIENEQDAQAGQKMAQGGEWTDEDANNFTAEYIEPIEKRIKDYEDQLAKRQEQILQLKKKIKQIKDPALTIYQ